MSSGLSKVVDERGQQPLEKKHKSVSTSSSTSEFETPLAFDLHHPLTTPRCLPPWSCPSPSVYSLRLFLSPPSPTAQIFGHLNKSFHSSTWMQSDTATRLPAPTSGIAVHGAGVKGWANIPGREIYLLRCVFTVTVYPTRSSTASRSSQYPSLSDKHAGSVRGVASSSPCLPQPRRIVNDSDTVRLLDACSAPFGSCSETESAVPQIATWCHMRRTRVGELSLGWVELAEKSHWGSVSRTL
ncbi:hypothetical protein R3P38DRAFT_3213676 [Favolaschia claudopus]|uniref:Uncharacterized protein n=1 Tax=Favolaschia claudopus TaxID=2862362 RepID=A0AAW0ACX6_9AGAR